MKSKYLFLNIFLGMMILLLVFENYKTWNDSFVLLPDSRIAAGDPQAGNANPSSGERTAEPMSKQSFNSIFENNIFSPERKDFPILAAASAEAQRPILRSQIILYGVAIAGAYEWATVANPGSPLQKGERQSQTLKVGERIGGYTLAKILPDRIVMDGNGETFEVLVYDSKHPKRRMEVRTEESKPVMAASIQPAPAAPSGEAPNPTPSQEAVEKAKEPVRTQLAALPYNKYTYQMLGPSAPVNRGKIIYSVPVPTAQ